MSFTENGLVIPRLPEIISETVQQQQLLIHPQINTSPDLLLGQLNTVYSDVLRRAYEHLEYANSQLKLPSAEGKGLEELALVKGIKRLTDTTTKVNVAVRAAPASLIRAGTLFEDPATGQRFYTLQNYTVSLSSLVKILVATNAANAPSGTTWSVTLNGNVISRTLPGGSFNLATEWTAFAASITSAGFVVSVTSLTGTLEMYISPHDLLVPMSFNSSNLFRQRLWSSIATESVNKGSDTVATAGNWRVLTTLGTEGEAYPITQSIIPGRDQESDEELRVRTRTSETATGRGTTRAVKANLLNTSGVLYVDVAQNTTGASVGGLPPYSIHCVVEGGTEQAIAKTIWETAGSCTPLFGTTTVIYTDEYNKPQAVKFSRPSALSIDFEVTYSVYDEETLSDNISTRIRNAVADYINSLGLGADVIPSRIYGSIYAATTGINVTQIRLKEHSGSTWQTTKLSVSATQFPSTVNDSGYITIINV